MNFTQAGNGRPIVLLHGWGGSWLSWKPIIDSLKEKYTVFAVDLPGFGLSELKRPYQLIDYVEDLKVFLTKSKIKQPILVGHSFGGQIAIKFALTCPEMISGLVLVDAAGVRNNNFSLLASVKVASFGKRMILSSPLANYFPKIRRWYYRFLGMTDRDYFATPKNQNLQLTLGKIMRDDLTSEFRKVKKPTLIFWGEKDEATPVEWAKIIHQEIPGSRLVVLPDAGHFSYLDDQGRFVHELTQFIKKHDN